MSAKVDRIQERIDMFEAAQAWNAREVERLIAAREKFRRVGCRNPGLERRISEMAMRVGQVIREWHRWLETEGVQEQVDAIIAARQGGTR